MALDCKEINTDNINDYNNDMVTGYCRDQSRAAGGWQVLAGKEVYSDVGAAKRGAAGYHRPAACRREGQGQDRLRLSSGEG